jgi:signal transduction histidine kinase/CheY-like chemotaxis protein
MLGWINRTIGWSGSVAGLAVFAVAGACLFEFVLVEGLSAVDSKTRSTEEALVKTGFLIHQTELAESINSVTFWDQAVSKLDNRFDREWTDANIGTYLLDDAKFDLVEVLDREGRPLFAKSHGSEVKDSSAELLLASAAPLVAAVRHKEIARGRIPARLPSNALIASPINASSINLIGGKPYFTVATLVQPDFGSALPKCDSAPIVVAAKAIDANFLAILAQRYGLKDPRIGPVGRPGQPDQASFDVSDSSGKPILSLYWSPHRPGGELLRQTWIEGVAALVLLLTVLFLSAWATRRAYKNLTAAYKDLAESESRLRQALVASEEANHAKSEFLAVMSHEIRTPLNGVLGMVDVMKRGALPKEQRDRLEVIGQSGETLLVILNDVLDISKIAAGKLELEETDFDLELLARGVQEMFEPLAHKKGLEFTLALDAEARGIYRGDPVRIRQILLNLMSNAVKFTSDGSVRVDVGLIDDRVSVSVADTGMGIAPGLIERIFDKFVQGDSSTTRRFGGTGLGLSICKALCEAMGGVITVQSEVGRGSCFTVNFPLARVGDGKAGAARDLSAASPLDEQALRILAAEDNAVNQLVLRTLLGQAGLEPVIVGNGADAVAAWEQGDWDVILMDIQMPVLDGVEATRRIRRQEKETGRTATPIIALTANAMPHQAASYLAAGMNGLVTKPIEIAKLFAAIADAVEAESSSAAA